MAFNFGQGLQQGAGLLNSGRNIYSAGSWAGNTALPWLQGQLGGGAATAGNAAGGAAAGVGATGEAAAGVGAAGAAAGGLGAATAAAAPEAAAGALAGLEAIGPAFGLLLASDKRLKTDIRRVGLLDNGLPVYSFRLLNGAPQIGLLAQDVQKVNPGAVTKGPMGLLMLDYNKATEDAPDAGA